MQDLINSKNTYMSYFKKEEVKKSDDLEEKTRSHVISPSPLTPFINSSAMIWHVETTNRSTARNANTRASGASTERRERSLSRDLVPHSLRMFQFFNIISEGKFTVGERT